VQSVGSRVHWLDTRPRHADFIFRRVSRLVMAPIQPPTDFVLGTLALREKRPGREGDRSPPSSARVTISTAVPLQPLMSSWAA
jgi:hypothetical protein